MFTVRRGTSVRSISVLGCGYLGVTHAACMAELGHQVVAVDTDDAKVAALTAGEVPFYEPGLQELVDRHLRTGRLHFTTSYSEAAAQADIHFICVGTPQGADGAADLGYVDSVVDALAPWLDRECLVVGKSTVPVGTAARIAHRLVDRAPGKGAVLTAWNPEFLREGHGIADTLQPDRIVLGVQSPQAEKLLRDLYAPLADAGVPILVTDFATAELAKAAANSFLATKISFINALAEVCEATTADVVELAEVLALDRRIGGEFLKPGIGFGGGCLPKDLRALQARTRELGVGDSLAFLSEVDAVNLRRREKAAHMIRQQCGGTLEGKRIAALGISFKPNSDDIRDSPALHVARRLSVEGAYVSVYDPKAMKNAQRCHPELHYEPDVKSACLGADVVTVLTEWQEFQEIDPWALGSVVAQRQVVDGRNTLKRTDWERAGWVYGALGRRIRS
ncbi:UDP-glucose 6-dehydrogenase [Streptomyces viridochromogenes]|nr:UDP-glucose 6-dehydrogenase [Streptomyces viridochromogenes]KOG18603.1 UDP-glucose 6-dehydrogenase [Streptomyces viridochromogenes]